MSTNTTVANMGPSLLKSHLDLLRECKLGKLSIKVIKSLKENSFQNVPTLRVTGKQTKLLCKWCIKLIQTALTGNDQIDLKLYYLAYIAHKMALVISLSIRMTTDVDQLAQLE